jgi:hypothetical protein
MTRPFSKIVLGGQNRRAADSLYFSSIIPLYETWRIIKRSKSEEDRLILCFHSISCGTSTWKEWRYRHTKVLIITFIMLILACQFQSWAAKKYRTSSRSIIFFSMRSIMLYKIIILFWRLNHKAPSIKFNNRTTVSSYLVTKLKF